MGADYHAYVCQGIRLTEKNFILKTKNQLYGKYKFDPDTGKKVEEWIEDGCDVSDIEEIWNLERYGFSVISDTEDKNIFIGISSKKIDLEYGNGYGELPRLMTATDREMLIKICQEHGINKTDADIKIYVVGVVSC